MKTLRIPFTILCLLVITAFSAQAAQLASAKVLKVTGTVTKYSPSGKKTLLKAGDILTEGDALSATAKSSADLVFSNGSELTIKQNSSLSIKKMEQESFASNLSYEQLQADPSKSQTLLELNYGKIDGHVKKLSDGSNFRINTPLGTAAIRGTFFTIALRYDSQTGDFTLAVTNIDGTVDIISTFSGDIFFGDDSEAEKEFEKDESAEGTEAKTNEIPATKTVKIRLSKNNPNRDAIINLVKAIVPAEIIVEDDTTIDEDTQAEEEASEEGDQEVESGDDEEIPDPEITPEDTTIQIVSPNTGS